MTFVNDANFQSAYKLLNKEQRLAVDTIDGPVMVIAGPGTGKTQILTLRIANILRLTDTVPESILALTFTKSGAKAMRRRLRDLIGATAYRVPIMTFHALAELLIREYPESYEVIVGSKAITDIEQIDLLTQILDSPSHTLLRPRNAPDFYIRSILTSISQLKQENITPDELRRRLSEKENDIETMERYHVKGAHKGKEKSDYKKSVALLEKQFCLLSVYKQYEASLRDGRHYDFDDMILETVKAVTNNETMRLDLQERYQYILADEHQDVNGAQNEILDQLTSFHEQPNLFVVGDEKQAIYRFQGASLENFVHFEKKYKSTVVISLTSNYRSTQAILDASHEVVAVDSGPLIDYRKPLTAVSVKQTELKIKEYSNHRNEDESLIKNVTKNLSDGVNPGDIAVIVRTNREVARVTDLLRRAQIMAEPSADGDILTHPIFQAVYNLLAIVTDIPNEEQLAKVLLSAYSGLDPIEKMDLFSRLTYNVTLWSLLKESINDSTIPGAVVLNKINKLITDCQSLMLTTSVQRVVAKIIVDSGLYEKIFTTDPIGGVRVLRRLYDEVEQLVSSQVVKNLSDVVKVLGDRINHQLPLIAPYSEISGTGIQVMTAHKAKGLEFEHVYIPYVTESSWGASLRPDYFKLPLMLTSAVTEERYEDEKRLLYVAMTRAKSHLTITYSNSNGDGKEQLPAPVLEPVMAKIGVDIDSDEVPTLLAVLRDTESVPQELRHRLIETIKNRGFSATSLNNAIKNPWHYFFRNVLRLPEPQTPALQFGSSVHDLLEYIVREHTKHGVVVDFSVARKRFEESLSRLPLSITEFTDLFAKGQEALAVYLPHLIKTLPKVTKTEFSVEIPFLTSSTIVPETVLKGKLDRLDFDGDKVIKVVDYKTGKPKTRNDILGLTASSDGNYARQLAFYTMLLSEFDSGVFSTNVGVLSFVEPDTNGQIREETVVTEMETLRDLREIINETISVIASGSFMRDESLLENNDYEALARVWFNELN